uniref:HTH cro/C1-type domain-containing protein n=1 Tax=Thermosporothrix sp. COM3 TaxID=2490863 RepID=A0A455SIR3_9CHLR|nr:hypothetical protein KTC_15900 [Thermosporothrix sp. COM3]
MGNGVRVYWGMRGEYGPYSKQEDGWPNAGEVLLDYHRRSGKSAQEIARLYNERTGSSIKPDWIYKMEYRNKVPLDIHRRRALAEIVGIPLGLFGLASLSSIADTKTAYAAPAVLQYAQIDIDRYHKDIQLFWKLHYSSTAGDSLTDILAQLKHLEGIEKQARGDLQKHSRELLNSYYRLAATLFRDRGDFLRAYTYANHGVRVARQLGDDPTSLQLLAASQYTRGFVLLVWGAIGDSVQQGQITLKRDKIATALTDFERALPNARPQLKGIIYSEMARARALQRSSPIDETLALTLLKKAEDLVGLESDVDAYNQILLDGDMKGLDERRWRIGRAKTMLALRRPTEAIEELDELELLSGQTHTRRRAWTDILYAQSSLAMQDWFMATQKAISACNECKEVQSLAHITRVRDIYKQLLHSPYKQNREVKRLGELLNAKK